MKAKNGRKEMNLIDYIWTIYHQGGMKNLLIFDCFQVIFLVKNTLNSKKCAKTFVMGKL